MPKVKNTAVLKRYAEAKELYQQDYREALTYFLLAKDFKNCVRLYLDKLGYPEQAFELVRENKNIDGARMCAEYSQSVNDFKAAIEFFLLANLKENAFNLAILHDETNDTVSVFEELINYFSTSSTNMLEDLSNDYVKLAKYYESKNEFLRAAEYYTTCGQYHRAMKLYLKCNSEESIERAIEVVGKARNDVLTHSLIDFLMGENDNTPKDASYIFKLYLSLNNYVTIQKQLRLSN